MLRTGTRPTGACTPRLHLDGASRTVEETHRRPMRTGKEAGAGLCCAAALLTDAQETCCEPRREANQRQVMKRMNLCGLMRTWSCIKGAIFIGSKRHVFVQRSKRRSQSSHLSLTIVSDSIKLDRHHSARNRPRLQHLLVAHHGCKPTRFAHQASPPALLSLTSLCLLALLA